ncbi:hypothetical protein [Streptomyces sp. NPDC051561]|uniref:hypothetical protein n=1 Tax=Streptomyces sp. NPDC051561 TaxID=3365658 RepID=UPI00379368CC
MTSHFESHRLNTMIDLVEAGNPQALEETGRSLMSVRTAFFVAAKELRDHLAGANWKGESATEFRRFGARLADHADELGEYARRVGTELQEAGAGLTAVRNSLPPRDASPATPSEPHRQEAVNQLNRLASYYTVSAGHLAGTPAPVFDEELAADVPRPRDAGGVTGGGGAGGAGAPGVRSGGGTQQSLSPSQAMGEGAGVEGVVYDASRGMVAGPAAAGTLAPVSTYPADPTDSTHPTSFIDIDPTSPSHPGASTSMELSSVTPSQASGAPSSVPQPATPQAQPLTPTAAPAPLAGIAGGIPLPPPLTGTSGIPAQSPTSGALPARSMSAAGRPVFPTSPYGVSGGTPTRPATASTPGAFTRGGAGLVRPGVPPLSPPPGTPQRNTPRRNAPQSASPLTEDAETWTSAQGPAAPPVINHSH